MSFSSDATESQKSISTYDSHGRIVEKIDGPGQRCVTVYKEDGASVGGRESVAPKEGSGGEFME